MRHDRLIDASCVFEQRRQHIREENARQQRTAAHAEDLESRFDLVRIGALDLKTLRTDGGVKAFRFGFRGRMANVWYVDIPQHNSDKNPDRTPPSAS